MDLSAQSSMSALDTDLERLLQEQTRKLSVFGIFPPPRHISDAHLVEAKPSPRTNLNLPPSLQASTITSSKKTHPSELFSTSGATRRSAGDSASGRLDRVAETEERIARLLGVDQDDDKDRKSKTFDYDMLLRPAMADMPQSAADVLNRIRQKAGSEKSAILPVKSSKSSMVTSNKQINRQKVSEEKSTRIVTEESMAVKLLKKSMKLSTKSDSRLSSNKAVEKVVDRIRSVNSNVTADLIIAGKNSEDALSYVDITAKTLGKEATVQIMKAKLTAKEAELSNISETASKNHQLAQKKAAELKHMEQEHRGLKEKQLEQEKKLRACSKQLEEARRTSEALTAEVERLSKESKEIRKGKVDVKKRAMPEISVVRLTAANDKAVKELVTLKDQNKVLKETGERLHKDVESRKKKHESNLRRFLSIVQKQEALMKCVTTQKTLSGQMQLLKRAEDDFHKLIDVTSFTS